MNRRTFVRGVTAAALTVPGFSMPIFTSSIHADGVAFRSLSRAT